MKRFLLFYAVLEFATNMLADVAAYPFIATDTNGKVIQTKFTGINGNLQNTLTLKYKEDPTGLTFKVNGAETAYNATSGMTISSTLNSQKNDTFVVSVYSGETLVAEQTFTYIPRVSVSSYKALPDGTEAVLLFNSGNKVTYVSADGTTAFVEDASKALELYNIGINLKAYRTISSGYIWGVKNTYNNDAEIISCDSTATCSSVTQTETEVTPVTLTMSQVKSGANQLRYAKINAARIVKNGTEYSVSQGSDVIATYDIFQNNVMATVSETPRYADLTCIVGINAAGTLQLWPLAVGNVCDKLNGSCGSVTWTIDIDGNMVFGAGSLDATGISNSKRPWADFVHNVKTVRFEAGATANADNSYMFKEMTNLESVDFTNFNTSALTTMKGFFNGCTSLKVVDMSMLDLDKVTTWNLTFNACSALESVNIGDNSLAAVTDFTSTFYSCHALKALDFSKVTGAAVTKMAAMLYDCTALESVDLRAFSTAKVSSANNAKNVFGSDAYAAMPKTMKLSKSFGKIAVADSYVALPAKKYYVRGDSQKYFDLANDTNAQTALYAYNAALDEYGVYVDDPSAADVNTVNASVDRDYNHHAKFLRNGQFVIINNGRYYNTAGQRTR